MSVFDHVFRSIFDRFWMPPTSKTMQIAWEGYQKPLNAHIPKTFKKTFQNGAKMEAK